MLRSGNPALNAGTFSGLPRAAFADDVMTVQGTTNKTLMLFLFMLVPAFITWSQFFAGNLVLVNGLMMGGLIGGLVMALVTTFKKTWAPVTAPMYAALEGAALGGISATFEMRYPGVVIQGVGLTFTVLAAMLMAYKAGIVTASDRFVRGLVAATGGVFLLYLVEFGLSFFGVHIPYIHESGVIGIGFSLVVATLAALNLVLDFAFIEDGARRGAPKYMEWYGAFGLVVTLVWLYLEILRLLVKIQGGSRSRS